MDVRRVRGASGGADPAGEEARGEVLRGVGAEVAVDEGIACAAGSR